MDVADPIPPSVKALVDLFKNELASVAFPGVDGAILEQLMTDVKSYTEAVIKAEAALEAARIALRDSEEALAVKTQKALAYARVYAEDRPEIASKVDYVARIAGTTSTSSASSSASARDREPGSDAPKRRGRQKKTATPEPTDATPTAPTVAEAVADAAMDSSDMTPAAPAVMDISVEEVDASVLDAMAN